MYAIAVCDRSCMCPCWLATLAHTLHTSVSVRIPGKWHVVVLVARTDKQFFECSVLMSVLFVPKVEQGMSAM